MARRLGPPPWRESVTARLDAQTVANSMVAAAKAARDLTGPDFAAALAHAERYTRANTLAPLEAELRRLAGR